MDNNDLFGFNNNYISRGSRGRGPPPSRGIRGSRSSRGRGPPPSRGIRGSRSSRGRGPPPSRGSRGRGLGLGRGLPSMSSPKSIYNIPQPKRGFSSFLRRKEEKFEGFSYNPDINKNPFSNNFDYNIFDSSVTQSFNPFKKSLEKSEKKNKNVIESEISEEKLHQGEFLQDLLISTLIPDEVNENKENSIDIGQQLNDQNHLTENEKIKQLNLFKLDEYEQEEINKFNDVNNNSDYSFLFHLSENE
eukprot:TRINITY_DN9967_c0_g1_i1.p1 TRINITY_DN9967_c0_g1~~TRINITY_DN9967_c0_g1_i1.p1  ORF type:complete len:246 (-),score=92.72 TRINITY_DN9967_c0_g1_i1:27-764(-)